jgi:Asp/Glu/Hydantoin racemase
MPMSKNLGPRIALIHALEESVLPTRKAFADLWPEAQIFDLLDTSLAVDLAAAGKLDDAMFKRFDTLARYAAGVDRAEWKADGILFTCSAFGPAIDAVKTQLAIPVYRPNESAFVRAIAAGVRIGLIVTFPPSLPALSLELREMANVVGRSVEIEGRVAAGALEALKAGDGAAHDALIDAAARSLPEVDIIVIGQFSAARAAPLIERWSKARVVTTPACAVDELRMVMGSKDVVHSQISKGTST